jgi:DNA polymerase III alpha subunit
VTSRARRFVRWPGAVELAAGLGRACAFDLALVAPQLPPFPTPGGLDKMTYLRRLVEQGAAQRYGPRGGVDPRGNVERNRKAWSQIDHELAVIGQLGYPGYFLVVWDIVEFCLRADIYCQGRGSAANSAVCYALGVTSADPVTLGLLFERFLSRERDGPPDIDLDIESGRREEAIQYVYRRYAWIEAQITAKDRGRRPGSCGQSGGLRGGSAYEDEGLSALMEPIGSSYASGCERQRQRQRSTLTHSPNFPLTMARWDK